MACYHPIPASQDGQSQPRLWPPMGEANLALPCGKCIGCRTDRATQWAHRCSHEAASWKYNTFLTLTYDDENLPPEGHLVASDLQKFLKRLRKYANGTSSSINRDRSGNIRFFACGEYGDRNDRPHYHALLFNCGFSDRHRVGKDLYESDALAKLWTKGHHRFGDATPAAASYIAQYNLKKQGAGDHDADGVWRPAPFLRMSLKPAIGSRWLEKYADDLTHGYLVEGGHRHAIPRTYRVKLKTTIPALAEEINVRLQKHRQQTPGDSGDPERRKAQEIIHKRLKELNETRRL